MNKKFVLLLTFFSILVLLVTSCSGKSNKGYLGVQRGSQLSTTVWAMETKDVAYYGETASDGTVSYYKITPSDPTKKLALVYFTMKNEKANQLIINVDAKSYTLLNKQGTEIQPVDPFTTKVLAPNFPANESLRQWIWGKFTMKIADGVTGYGIFEVAPDFKATQFRWNTVETIYVRWGASA